MGQNDPLVVKVLTERKIQDKVKSRKETYNYNNDMMFLLLIYASIPASNICKCEKKEIIYLQDKMSSQPSSPFFFFLLY